MVIAERGKAALKTGSNDKGNLTILVTANATGKVGLPLEVWLYAQCIPNNIWNCKPARWVYDKTNKIDANRHVHEVHYGGVLPIFAPMKHYISDNNTFR